ncbi:transglutaminase domain-containing protein [Aestuariispira insulae]|uniref:transglutaminase domain-containing protein n=1 Tax=Aestuariispira insulae TaxID=1461337 RepID=UPI0015F27729|nr:transglutaminase domain-containing protein [Aestuariispira insulae]
MNDVLAAVPIYHQVRNIPYGGIGQRRVEDVLVNGRGSCSGKHLLLQKRLRQAGYRAEVVTIFTWFDLGIPNHPAMPDEIRAMLTVGKVPDYHHYVELHIGERVLKLDATWHDGLKPFGFPVNDCWDGAGDTVLAAPAVDYFPPQDDLAGFKAAKVAALSQNMQERRRRFFQATADWITELLRAEPVLRS